MSAVSSSQFEQSTQFERRKKDHIRYALATKNEAVGQSGLNEIKLIHEALPEIDFADVSLQCSSLAHTLPTPFLVSSMTAGHRAGLKINIRLAEACQSRGWRMGVGSQRRELSDAGASREWRDLRRRVPKVHMMGNLGLAQVIQTPVSEVCRLVEALEAKAMIVHLNALQEALQPEGTPQFRGGLKAIERLVKALPIPVIVKETGCGMSPQTVQRLDRIGVAAVDVAGLGGTHWGRIEGDRGKSKSVQTHAAKTFANWGLSTVESLYQASQLKRSCELWASGGVRSGLDAVKLLALGANTVGLAKPILQAAMVGPQALFQFMECIEFEAKTAMFCMGTLSLKELRTKKVWRWI